MSVINYTVKILQYVNGIPCDITKPGGAYCTDLFSLAVTKLGLRSRKLFYDGADSVKTDRSLGRTPLVTSIDSDLLPDGLRQFIFPGGVEGRVEFRIRLRNNEDK